MCLHLPFVLRICFSDPEAKCKYCRSFVPRETGLSPDVLETPLYSSLYDIGRRMVLKSPEYEQELNNIYDTICSPVVVTGISLFIFICG